MSLRLTEEEYARLIQRGMADGPLLRTVTPESESSFQGRLRRLAIDNGWLYYHTHDSRRSDKGFPDTVLTRPGELLFVELKRSPTAKPSHEQEVWLNMLQRSIPGVEVYVWRPSDWVAINERLTRSMQRDATPSTDTPATS